MPTPRKPARPSRTPQPDQDSDPDPDFERASALGKGLAAVPLGVANAVAEGARAYVKNPLVANLGFLQSLVRAVAPLDPIATNRSIVVHAFRWITGKQTLSESAGGIGKDVKKAFVEHSPIAKLYRSVDELSKLAGEAIWGRSEVSRARAQGSLGAAAVVVLASFLLPSIFEGIKARLGIGAGGAAAAGAAESGAAETAGARAAAGAAETGAAESGAAGTAERAAAGNGAAEVVASSKAPANAPGATSVGTKPSTTSPALRELEPAPGGAPDAGSSPATSADAPPPAARAPPQEPVEGFIQKLEGKPATGKGGPGSGESGAGAGSGRASASGPSNSGPAESELAANGRAQQRELGTLGDEEPSPPPVPEGVRADCGNCTLEARLKDRGFTRAQVDEAIVNAKRTMEGDPTRPVTNAFELAKAVQDLTGRPPQVKFANNLREMTTFVEQNVPMNGQCIVSGQVREANFGHFVVAERTPSGVIFRDFQLGAEGPVTTEFSQTYNQFFVILEK